MSHLAISLFGGFRAELDGLPLTAFGTDKNRALLAYLALESGYPHRRESLATLLWPDHPEAAARNSLRQALYHLRRIIPPGPEMEPHLLITSGQVCLNQGSDFWVDVLEFKSRLSACQLHHPNGLSLCAGCLEGLQRAVELYQGELLAGFTLPGCTKFTDWQVLTEEACHHQALATLSLLADYFETHLAYDLLIACTQRKIELEPWRESAYRRQMWALTMNGQRERALRQYEALCEILRREFGITPLDETRQLYEQIHARNLPSRRVAQVELRGPLTTGKSAEGIGDDIPFFGRQSELGQLHYYLSESLAGQGRVAFISGEAGSGKTSLMNEFARQAMRAHGDLLVAGGTCSAYCGLGDPYQPFREVLRVLAGIPAVSCGGADISSESALHLEALVAHLDSGQPVTTRVDPQMASVVFEPSALKKIDFLLTDLFDQVARLLQAISRRFPLLILLDDLQWLDRPSASLLFHLGGHLSGVQTLLLGAYRPEDLAPTGDRERHPLVAVLHEFQRRYGEINVDLSLSDGRAFMRDYLGCGPNRFDPDFLETFYRHTGGNALFTTELLRAMQARGDVVQDESGHWVQGPHLDWEQLPLRVEAVIAERLGRLDRESLTLLEAASIQGEVFKAGVLAQVLGVTEDDIIARLSGPLCKQHRLVSTLDLARQDSNDQACYQFRHLLYQRYLYQGLDKVERSRLHRVTTEAMGRLIRG